MKKLVAIAMGIVVSIALVNASPASAQYDDTFTVEVSAGTVVAGETLTVTGTCDAGGTVTATLGSGSGSAEAGTDGAYAITITVPALSAGDHTLTTTCGGETQQTTIHVGGGSTGTGTAPADLVRTGSSGTSSMLRVGGLLLLGGAALLLVGRRFRTA